MHRALKYFETIDDPRSIRNQKHPWMTLIGTSLLASLAGIDSFSGFADFTEAHFEKLQGYFNFPSGSPSHDTYQRLDVVFNEDGACIRNDNAAENIDILRKWALNGLQKCKQKPSQSIKSLMRKNSMSFKHLIESTKKIFHE